MQPRLSNLFLKGLHQYYKMPSIAILATLTTIAQTCLLVFTTSYC